MLVCCCLGPSRSTQSAPRLRRESRYSRNEAIKIKPCKQQSECEKMAGLNFLASCLKIRIACGKARVSVHIMPLISKVHLLANQSVSALQSILGRQDRWRGGPAMRKGLLCPVFFIPHSPTRGCCMCRAGKISCFRFPQRQNAMCGCHQERPLSGNSDISIGHWASALAQGTA